MIRNHTGRNHGLRAILLSVLLLAAGCGSTAVDTEAVVGELTNEVGVAPGELINLLSANDASSFATAIQDIDFSQITTATEFTIFAPNDVAFLALTADETAELLAAPENLVELLQFHIVPELLNSTDLAGRSSVTTAAGTSLEITTTEAGLRIGGAAFVHPDVDLQPGMAIHVIDTVLLP